MAGDLNINEQVVILDGGGHEAAALSAVEQASGGVTHQYGPQVVIAAVPPSAGQSLRQQVPQATVAGESWAVPDTLRGGLDEVGALGLDAFNLRQSPQYQEAKAQRPHAGEEWGSGAALPPDPPQEVRRAAEAGAPRAAEAGAPPTSARLTGKVAVGLIIVEGPTAALKFSAAERTKVVAEVQNGLTWLGSQSSPAGVTWVYDIKTLTLNVQPGPANESFEQKEARWRDPAMAQLGFGAGLAGVQAYVEQLRTQKGTDWSYCAFFTKYPLGWFAYASIGGPRLVMDYNNDGWGPDNIDRVFAHETGHIFNAPDEYASSGCNCGGQWGFFKVANANCENCAPGGGVTCIMKGNTWDTCVYTPYHLGFPQGQRYSGVFQAGTGGYGLWVNADWTSFNAKWQQWSGQGLRLEDIEISQPGGQVRYSGVFRQGTGGYGLWALANWTSFNAKWQQWSGQGLRLVDIETTLLGNELRYTGVFRQGTGGYGLWVNADWSSFNAKWQQWSGQGLRLVSLSITMVGGQPRYSGVFSQGTGGYGLWANADWSSFNAKWQQWSGQGLRLVDLEVTKVGNDLRYTGVFRQGTGGYGLWVNADWSSFVNKLNELSTQGLRLVDFDITLTGIEAAASPVAAGAAAGAGEAEESAGYGFLSLGEAPEGDELSGVGFGSVHLPGVSAGAEPGGAGGDGAGMGSASFSGSPGGAEAGAGAGFGSAHLAGVSAGRESGGDASGGDEGRGAGVGDFSLSGSSDSAEATSGAGYGAVYEG